MQAVVTTSDMEFDVSDIDFGYCTIHESVKRTVKLTNHSILPQQFGFIGLPEVKNFHSQLFFDTQILCVCVCGGGVTDHQSL